MEEKIRQIGIGDVAPDFTLEDNRKRTIHLVNYRGTKVLLSWHPLAWTSVCAQQMKSLEDHVADFARVGTIAMGLSIDSVPSKNQWAKQLLIAETMLLSDFWPHGGVARAYGLFRDVEGYSERANVLIDASGKVSWVKVYGVHELPDIVEVLERCAE